MKKKLVAIIAIFAIVALLAFTVPAVCAEGEDVTTEPVITTTEEITTVEETTTAEIELSQEDIEAIIAGVVDEIGLSDFAAEFWNYMPAWLKAVLSVFGIGSAGSLLAYVVVKAHGIRKAFGSSAQIDKDINTGISTLTKAISLIATVAKSQGEAGAQIANSLQKINYVAKALNLLVQCSSKEEVIARKDSLLADYQAAFGSEPDSIDAGETASSIAAATAELLDEIKNI